MLDKTAVQNPPAMASTTPPLDLAQRMWGLDWAKFFPVQLTPDVRVIKVTYHEASAFADKHFPSIYDLFTADQKFGEKQTPEVRCARRHYYENLGDFFIFEGASGPVGLAVGSILDWSSYNFRNAALLSAYQGQGLYYKFFDLLCVILKDHGVSRLEGDVSPSNRNHIHVINKMGYKITAVTLSERWGAQLHIVKYLDKEAEEQFGDLFDGPYNATTNQKISHER